MREVVPKAINRGIFADLQLICWLCFAQASPAGKRISIFVVAAICVMTVGVAALNAAAMVFNGYHQHIQALILQSTPQITLLKYERNQRIEQSVIDANESKGLIERLRSHPEVSGALEGVEATQTVEITSGVRQVKRRIKIVGFGAGFGPCPVPIFRPYTSKLASHSSAVPVVVTSDTFPALKEGSHVTIRTASDTIDAIVVGVPLTGVMPLSVIAMPLAPASRLLGQESSPDHIFVKLRDADANRSAAKRIQDVMRTDAAARIIALFWGDLFARLLGVLDAFKFLLLGMFSAIVIMGAVFTYAAFEIVVTRRRRGMAALVALGLIPSKVRSIFHLLAISMGLVSTVLGVIFSFPLVWGLDLLPLSPILAPSGLDNIPISTSFREMGLLLCFTCMFSWIAARLATVGLLRLDPAEEMRR